MRFETSQQMRMGQHMKLAPRMIQSMEILQMPMLALQERIEQELESNIALELVEPEAETEETTAQREDDRLAERLDQQALVIGEENTTRTDDWARLSEIESGYQEAYENEYSSKKYTRSGGDQERDRKMDAFANLPARGERLTEQLLHQWTFIELEPDVVAVGKILLAHVNDDGLLGSDLETILEQNQHVPGQDLSLELLERALTEIQQRLDPPGVAARNHRECMLLQVDRFMLEPDSDPGWSEVRRLIADHYDDLLQNRLPKIAQKTGLSLPEIQEAMTLMRKLNLSPGRDVVDEEVPPIIPDVVVEFDEEGDQYVAALCDGLLPALRVSKQYTEMAKDKSTEKETREFVTNNVRNAQWLIESINQRKNTLLRVVNVVLARQREYFDHGPQHLRPLPLIEVADHLGVHVATVSRAVADKWMQTPRGLVVLRKFFSGGTATEFGEDLSWEAVKAKLKEIIDNEDKSSPLSDSALADELKKIGIEIARRTVVKYRQQLDVPPARRRKVY